MGLLSGITKLVVRTACLPVTLPIALVKDIVSVGDYERRERTHIEDVVIHIEQSFDDFQ